MTDNHDSLMREIQEELDREKYTKLWDQYGTYIVGLLVAIVAGVGAYKYWENSQYQAAVGAGADYESALELITAEGASDQDIAKATTSFEKLSTSGPDGYRVLSKLQLAGVHAKAGKTTEALALYEALGKDTSVDNVLRDFAALQAATLRVGDADWTEMSNRLNALTGESRAFRNGARQLLGVAAFKAGKMEEARSAFEALLVGKRVPQSVRERANLYMAKIVKLDIAAEAASSTAKPGEASAQPEAGMKKETESSEGPAAKPAPDENAPAVPATP